MKNIFVLLIYIVLINVDYLIFENCIEKFKIASTKLTENKCRMLKKNQYLITY